MPLLTDDDGYAVLAVGGQGDLKVSLWAYQHTTTCVHYPTVVIRQQLDNMISREKFMLVFTTEKSIDNMIDNLQTLKSRWDFENSRQREDVQMAECDTGTLCGQT